MEHKILNMTLLSKRNVGKYVTNLLNFFLKKAKTFSNPSDIRSESVRKALKDEWVDYFYMCRMHMEIGCFHRGLNLIGYQISNIIIDLGYYFQGGIIDVGFREKTRRVCCD